MISKINRKVIYDTRH